MNAAAPHVRPGLLRVRQLGDHSKVTNIELFFDLVFVYAVTQLAHTLLLHLDVVGVAQTLGLFLAVWWAWVYTSWVTNWLDPERPAVRLLLLALTLAGLLMSSALPEALGRHGLLFAGAYVFMQLGRSLFMLWALRGGATANRRNFQRITIWLALSGTLWLAGAWATGPSRVLLWIVALALEYTGPAAGFYVPGMGRSRTTDWNVEGGHLAERCSLFVIIALGESVLDTGSSFAGVVWDEATVLAFVGAFVGSVAMWWIYFDLGAERGSRAIRRSQDPGRYARLAYTYLHLLIVAGIIVGAVADELTLGHPHAPMAWPHAAVLLGGPMLYVLGNALFKQTVNNTYFPLSHLVGLVLLALLAPMAPHLSTTALALTATAVLVLVAVWESLSLRSVRRALAGAE